MADIEKDQSNEQENAEGAVDETALEGGQPAKKSKKKLIIILLAVIIVIAVAAGFFAFKKMKDEQKKAEEEKAHAETKAGPIFHDLDEIIVNLNTEGKNVSFMKLKITFELDDKAALEVIQKMQPRINDVFQVYMRELRPIDMQGSVGIYRLREELLIRVNKVIYPAKVKDLLFREVLVQ